MTSPTTVARSVARDAERRARTALDDVLAAHNALRDADTALSTATQAQATAGTALVRAIATARDVGITPEHLAQLGITAPTPRTLRRRRQRPSLTPAGRTPDNPAGRTPDDPGDGHPLPAVVATAAASPATTPAAYP